MRHNNNSGLEHINVSVSRKIFDTPNADKEKLEVTQLVARLKAECRPELDEFYEHADPLIRDVRSMAVKILNGGNGNGKNKTKCEMR
jgi:hypothetical protein